MSSPSRSLNARVPHRQLLDQLGCTVRTHSLPQLMVCPVCGKGGMQGLSRSHRQRRLVLLPRL